jgi:DNA-binding MarR family transcriptional regulator
MTNKTSPERAEAVSLKNSLQREFIHRCKKNPSYSLRAYAQYLEIDQSFLSKLLNGRRKITPAMEEQFASKLGLSPFKGVKPSSRSAKGKDHFVDLLEDEYETIASWHHFVILELMKTKSFKPDYGKIAQQLGLHSQEVKAAVERLVRLGFVKVADKKWTLVSKNHTWTNTMATSTARRKLQIELNQKSVEALENIPFSQRENGSLTIAIDSRRLPEFKEKINQVLKDLSDCLQPDQKNLDSVYQITLSLFPILKNNIKENQDENT